MDLISIIVPVYNVENYLRKCLDSILVQTYSLFEVIVIDDGSTDKCSQICDEYARKDRRIKVVHKENGGLSDARNAGIKIAQGEYLLFVDSDDYIQDNMLEILMKSIEETNADIVITTKYFTVSAKNDKFVSEITGKKVCNSGQALEEIFCHNSRWEAWGTLFKKSLFDNMEFPKGKLYEDIALIPLIILKAEEVCLLEGAYYYYYIREGSIMDASKTKVKIDLLEVCSNVIRQVENKVKDNQTRCNIIAGIMYELVSRMELARRNKKLNKEFISSSLKFLRKRMKYIFLSNQMSLKMKLYCVVGSLGMGEIWSKVSRIKNTRFR